MRHSCANSPNPQRAPPRPFSLTPHPRQGIRERGQNLINQNPKKFLPLSLKPPPFFLQDSTPHPPKKKGAKLTPYPKPITPTARHLKPLPTLSKIPLAPLPKSKPKNTKKGFTPPRVRHYLRADSAYQYPLALYPSTLTPLSPRAKLSAHSRTQSRQATRFTAMHRAHLHLPPHHSDTPPLPFSSQSLFLL